MQDQVIKSNGKQVTVRQVFADAAVVEIEFEGEWFEDAAVQVADALGVKIDLSTERHNPRFSMVEYCVA